jgi:hypothetical protein
MSTVPLHSIVIWQTSDDDYYGAAMDWTASSSERHSSSALQGSKLAAFRLEYKSQQMVNIHPLGVNSAPILMVNQQPLTTPIQLQSHDWITVGSTSFCWHPEAFAFARRIIAEGPVCWLTLGTETSNSFHVKPIHQPGVQALATLLAWSTAQFWLISLTETTLVINGVETNSARVKRGDWLRVAQHDFSLDGLFNPPMPRRLVLPRLSEMQRKGIGLALVALSFCVISIGAVVYQALQNSEHARQNGYTHSRSNRPASSSPSTSQSAAKMPIVAQSKRPMPTCNYQVELQQLREACNLSHVDCRQLARQLAAQHPGELNIAQISTIYDYVVRRWRFISDPIHQEQLTPASETIAQQLVGDCDDFGILVATLLMAVGGEVRFNKAYRSEQAHAYIEVNVGRQSLDEITAYLQQRYQLPSKNRIQYRTDESGNHWLNLDWGIPHPGGPYFDSDYGIRFYPQLFACEDF